MVVQGYLFTFHSSTLRLKYQVDFRNAFRTLWNMYDGAFYENNEQLKGVIY